MKLFLNSNAEFISLGGTDIVVGESFKILDAGGSLPLGMTVADWRRKFGVKAQEPKCRPQAKIIREGAKKKKRKTVLEDSSDEDDYAAFDKAPAHPRKKQYRATVEGHDGLMVRAREAADDRV